MKQQEMGPGLKIRVMHAATAIVSLWMRSRTQQWFREQKVDPRRLYDTAIAVMGEGAVPALKTISVTSGEGLILVLLSLHTLMEREIEPLATMRYASDEMRKRKPLLALLADLHEKGWKDEFLQATAVLGAAKIVDGNRDADRIVARNLNSGYDPEALPIVLEMQHAFMSARHRATARKIERGAQRINDAGRIDQGTVGHSSLNNIFDRTAAMTSGNIH